jgi:hypothetical protein
MYIDERWLTTIPSPTSPYYGALASMAALVALVALLPLCWVLRKRGFTIWPAPSSGQATADAAVRLPTLRDSWWLLLATLGVMVGGLVLAVGLIGGG